MTKERLKIPNAYSEGVNRKTEKTNNGQPHYIKNLRLTNYENCGILQKQ